MPYSAVGTTQSAILFLDGNRIDATYQLEQIVRAEPDAALFVVPPDYSRRDVNMMSAQSTAVLSSAGCVEAKKP
jgi:hypothetical protein